jgi:hypothetical protein
MVEKMGARHSDKQKDRQLKLQLQISYSTSLRAVSLGITTRKNRGKVLLGSFVCGFVSDGEIESGRGKVLP